MLEVGTSLVGSGPLSLVMVMEGARTTMLEEKVVGT